MGLRIIQAFSRTNRLLTKEAKPFGTIKYYRMPHTMEQKIRDAVKLYSGDKPFALFVDKIDKNLENMNDTYRKICDLFESAGIEDFMTTPDSESERKMFVKLFNEFNKYLDSARVQGFVWKKSDYTITDSDGAVKNKVHVNIDERTYLILVQRYKELLKPISSGAVSDVPYDIDGYLTTIATDDIDANYMNFHFNKFLKLLHQPGVSPETIKQAEEELHRTFATLSEEDQKIANLILHDIERGEAVLEDGKELRDYIADYKANLMNDRIHRFASTFGLDESKLRMMLKRNITESNINEFGDYDELKKTFDRSKAKEYFTQLEGKPIPPPKVVVKMDNLLRSFLLTGGTEGF